MTQPIEKVMQSAHEITRTANKWEPAICRRGWILQWRTTGDKQIPFSTGRHGRVWPPMATMFLLPLVRLHVKLRL